MIADNLEICNRPQLKPKQKCQGKKRSNSSDDNVNDVYSLVGFADRSVVVSIAENSSD